MLDGANMQQAAAWHGCIFVAFLKNRITMPFITKSNAKSILFEIDLLKVGNIPTDGIYPGDLSALSESERRWLAAGKMFYEDFEFFVKYAYKKKAKPVDTRRYVYEGRMPSYHADRTCGNLLSDYFNFAIPVEIQNQGKDGVDIFRVWFRANEQLLQVDTPRFITRMELEFRLRNPPTVTSLEAPNSGIEEIQNLSLDQIRDDIDTLLEDAEKMRSSGDQSSRIIRLYGNLAHKPFDDEETNRILKEWLSLKQKIKSMLLEYFKVSFNPDLRFEGMLLDQLGFSQCRSCHLKADDQASDISEYWPI